MLPGVLLSALLVFLFVLTVTAQETVIIPYDATKPIASQQPDQRYVPYERFMQLWDAAKARKRGPVPPVAPQKFILDSARYEAVLDGKMMQITATIDLHIFGDDWVEVPLEFCQRQWSAVTLDGEPAPYLKERLVIKKPGAHQVILTSTEPFRPEQRDWSMRIPKTAASVVVITLPGAGGTVTFQDEHPTTERLENGRKIVSTVLGTTHRLKVAIDQQAIAAAPLTEPDSAIIRNQITVSGGWERIVTRADFDLAGSTLDHFSLLFPTDCQPVALNGADIRSWKLTTAPEGQRLDVSLTASAKESYALELISERPLVAGTHQTPVISAAARRVENRVELIAGPGMEFAGVQPGEARQVASEQPVKGLFAAWSLTKPGATIGYEVKATQVKREAKISTVYQVSRRKIEVIASLTLAVAGDADPGNMDFENRGRRPRPQPDVTILIPRDFAIETVQSASLRDWWQERDELHLRFNAATGPIPLVLYLVRQFDSAPASLQLVPIHPLGFAKVTGEAVIAAHMGDEAGLTLAGTAKQVAPETAARDFSILAPLERKRAFTYTNLDFSGKVTLSPLPLKLGAAYVTHVQAHEGWLDWQTKVRLVVRQGSTRKVQFSLPSDLPVARVTGPEVRETTSKVSTKAPTRRVYEVSLQNDLVSSTELTIDLEQSAGQPVATLKFADLEREDGYLVAENVSDYEMSLQPKNLDVAQSSDLPFLPPLTTGASLHRLRPGWSLGVTMQRLEKTGSRAAFAAWAEITTAIRPDGTEWNRIVWHLQNRSLQFLPVRLPSGGELVGARVAGESVRADAGEVDGQKVTLIPLIKTRPGDISYDVEMVWRRTGLSRLGWLTGRTLDDPDLVGITVERTLWNLYLPEDHPLPRDPDRVGNMDSVIAEVNKTEKLSGMLEELKSLNSFVTSTRSESSYARAKAKENFDRLARDLEKATEEVQQGRSDYDDQPTARRQRAMKQQADVSQVQSQLLATLADEKKKQLNESAPEPSQPAEAGERDKNWGDNRDYMKNSSAVVARELQKEMKINSGQNQLYFNDGVVLNNIAVPQEKAGGKANGADFKSIELSQSATESISQAQGVETEGADNFREAEKPAEQAMGKLVLGSARGNAMNITTGPAATPAAPVKDEIQIQSGAENAPMLSSVAAFTAPWTSGGKAGGGEQRKISAPGVKGRVSLNADFPLEGRVWHFKKLKANARLDFRVGSVPLVERWQRIGWFALGGVGLLAAGWLRDRRRVR